jgi:PHD/YefM family antitoxin component YafN of YafNO toxin-antitoxin module
MVQPGDIHTLNEFKQDSMRLIERIEESGRPAVLTVEGKAKVVLLDVATFERLAAAVEHLETTELLRDRLEEIGRGRGRLMLEVLEELRQEFGIHKASDGQP